MTPRDILQKPKPHLPKAQTTEQFLFIYFTFHTYRAVPIQIDSHYSCQEKLYIG